MNMLTRPGHPNNAPPFQPMILLSAPSRCGGLGTFARLWNAQNLTTQACDRSPPEG